MQRVIRDKVFETNSSSTHSISIVGGTYTPDKLPIEDGVCKVYPGEFGWDEHTFNLATVKASYCLTHVKGGHGNSEMLREVLRAETGCEVEFVSKPKKNAWDYEWGYIDHKSGDVCDGAFESKATLRDFIFNPASYVRTDNDNHI